MRPFTVVTVVAIVLVGLAVMAQARSSGVPEVVAAALLSPSLASKALYELGGSLLILVALCVAVAFERASSVR